MGQINHILIFSTPIHFTLLEEEYLYSRYHLGVETGEWGLYDALTPTKKFCVILTAPGRAVWVSNCLVVVYF